MWMLRPELTMLGAVQKTDPSEGHDDRIKQINSTGMRGFRSALHCLIALQCSTPLYAVAHYRPYYHIHRPRVGSPSPRLIYEDRVTNELESKRICSSIETFISTYEAPSFSSPVSSQLRRGTLVNVAERKEADRITWVFIIHASGSSWVTENKLC